MFQLAFPKMRVYTRAMSGPCYCILLRKASRRLSALYDEALEPHGINIGQFSQIRTIGRNQPVSLTELGGLMELDRSTVGRNTKVLERMGLVETVPGEDQREALLQLTEKGRALLEETTPIWEGVQATLHDKLGETNGNVLQQLLEVI